MKRTLILAGTFLGLGVLAQAQANDHAVLLDTNGSPVLAMSSGTCVRTRWIEDHDPCRPGMVQSISEKRNVIAEDERAVYFPFNKATLTPEAKRNLDTLASDIKSRDDITGASVFGYADRIGTHSYNDKLSKKRAEVVRNYLVAKGIVNANVTDTRWFGSGRPTTDCPKNLGRADLIQCLGKDRRVEVEITYASDVVAQR